MLPTFPDQPSIAIVYDRINKFGGAEQVLLALHQAFPSADLLTAVFDEKGGQWVKDWIPKTSFVQSIPFAKTNHEKLALLMPLAFETLDLTSYDIVISVTSEFAKAVITRPNQLHICYCLTPTRYLWSHTHEYEGKRLRWLKRLAFTNLRQHDYVLASRPDRYIAISSRVADRISKYYRRPVDAVIYPPVRLPTNVHLNRQREFFLVVSRLVPYKRVDLAIQAALRSKQRLVIVGTGSDESRLRSIANDSPLITFGGFVPDSELNDYYERAIALICPQEEDFGIVSLEAQAHGTPVITYAHSGVVETILPQTTGIVVESQTSDSFAQAIAAVDQHTFDRKRIAAQAARFATTQFIDEWRRVLAKRTTRYTSFQSRVE